jgi:hypothetical protein
MEESMKLLMSILKDEAEDIGVEAKLLDTAGENQPGGGLLMILPVNEDADEDEGCVLTEIAASNLGDGAYYLQLYSIVFEDVGGIAPELLRTINDVNAKCPVGSFGLTPEGDKTELYHRHSIVFTENADFNELAMYAMAAIAAIALAIRIFLTRLDEATFAGA